MNVINIFKRIINKYKFKKLMIQPIDKSTVTLIENALKLFPDTLDFSDGELRDDNGFFSNNLSEAWSNAEEQNISKDENIDFMIWSIYGVLHKKCRHLFEIGIYSLNIHELDYDDINAEYIKACIDANVKF